MKRFSFPLLLLLLCSMFSWNKAGAFEIEKIMIKGDLYNIEDLKPGAIVVFNNGMTNSYNTTNAQQDMPNVFLCGTQLVNNTWASANSLGVLTGLSSDNLFELVEAPEQSGQLTDTEGNKIDTTLSAFYIKHVDTKKFVKGDVASKVPVLVDNISDATSFSAIPINLTPRPGASKLGECNTTDQSLALVHFETSGPIFFGPCWNYGFSHYQASANDNVIWNAYKVDYTTSALKNLEKLVAELESNIYLGGTAPGYFDQNKVDDYYDAQVEAMDAIEMQGLTEEQYAAIFKKYADAYEAVVASRVPLTDGYYYIVSKYPEFETKIAQEVGWMGYEDDKLYWNVLERNNPAYIFKITKVDSVNYTIQNYAYSTYINYAKNNRNQYIELSKEVDQYQQIAYMPQSLFGFKNPKTSRYYYTDAFAYGARPKGHIGCNSNAYDLTTYAFALEAVPQETIDALAASVEQIRLTGQVSNLIDEAITTYNSAFTYEADMENGLIKEYSDDPAASQITSIYSVSEGSIANLNDGDATTYVKLSPTSSTPSEFTNFVVDLKDDATSTFVFKLSKRNNTYGQNERPSIITIYARNSTDDDWTKIEKMNMPTQSSIVDMYRGVAMGTPYRYVRFDVEEINNKSVSWGYPWFVFGEFQMYPAKLDEEHSQYSYGEGVKEACDNLLAQLNIARQSVTDNNSTEQNYNDLLAAINAVKPLLADSNDLVNDIQTVKKYVEYYNVGEDFGQVTETDMEAIETALETANSFDRSKLIKADIAQRTEALETAFEAFKKQQKREQANVWYYISNTDTTRTGDTANVYATKVFGNVIYAPSATTVDQRMQLDEDELWHGAYDRENDIQTNLDYAASMWRLVVMSDTTYALQNRATGTYMGALYEDAGNGLSAEPVPYEFALVGPGQFNIICQDTLNVDQRPLHASGEGRLKTWAGGYCTASSWTLLPVEDDELGVLTMPIEPNSISIMTLPFTPGQIIEGNEGEGFSYYSIKGMSTDSTIELSKITESSEITAGVPFIIVNNDYTAYDADEEYVNMVFEFPTEYVTEAKTVNGLVGVLNGKNILAEGYGYFEDAVFKSTTNTGAFIEGQTGYFNPDEATTTTEAGDITLTCEGKLITGIKNVSAAANAKNVNVYSVDGKLIKKNVNSLQATQSLKKGIYIIGKKKVAIK